MNDHILLDDLLSLLDKTLLECLDFLEHLPCVWVGTLELPPTMVVERVLELLGESLDGKTLSKQLLVEVYDFLTEFIDLGSLGLYDSELTFQISNGVVKNLDVLESLLVLVLTLTESGLKNLDLLVE